MLSFSPSPASPRQVAGPPAPPRAWKNPTSIPKEGDPALAGLKFFVHVQMAKKELPVELPGHDVAYNWSPGFKKIQTTWTCFESLHRSCALKPGDHLKWRTVKGQNRPAVGRSTEGRSSRWACTAGQSRLIYCEKRYILNFWNQIIRTLNGRERERARPIV